MLELDKALVTVYRELDSDDGFVITAFIGPLGLLVAYTSKQRKGGPNRKDKITSAWLGFAFFVLWFGLIFVF